jgi:hypothetical protein
MKIKMLRLEPINEFLGHPGLDSIVLNFIKEVLIAVPVFHFSACFICIARSARGNQIISIA